MNLESFQAVNCNIAQYKNNEFKNIDEVVICEESFNISYTCTYEGKTYKDEKNLYAYPNDIEKLALGHIILDCLPFYDTEFSYEISRDEKHYNLILEARNKIEKDVNNKEISLTAEEISQTMEKILSNQGKWKSSGCFHCATLYDTITKELIIAEDIGRHNCIDRLKGYCTMHNLDMQSYILFVTARVTASLYAKIRRAGINTIISKSAITSTSLQRAREDDCTLIGFCRQDATDNAGRFTVYNKGSYFIL